MYLSEIMWLKTLSQETTEKDGEESLWPRNKPVKSYHSTSWTYTAFSSLL